MPNNKLRIIAHNESAMVRPRSREFLPAKRARKVGTPSSTEENVRLIKAFSGIDDPRRRAWLLELVEHFAGLDAPAH